MEEEEEEEEEMEDVEGEDEEERDEKRGGFSREGEGEMVISSKARRGGSLK